MHSEFDPETPDAKWREYTRMLGRGMVEVSVNVTALWSWITKLFMGRRKSRCQRSEVGCQTIETASDE